MQRTAEPRESVTTWLEKMAPPALSWRLSIRAAQAAARDSAGFRGVALGYKRPRRPLPSQSAAASQPHRTSRRSLLIGDSQLIKSSFSFQVYTFFFSDLDYFYDLFLYIYYHLNFRLFHV